MREFKLTRMKKIMYLKSNYNTIVLNLLQSKR